jgi:1,4-alpha-glucan branching enzyme
MCREDRYKHEETMRSLILNLALVAAAAAAPSPRPGLGSSPFADASGTGVTFRVWAPAATQVVVAGTFNGWNMAAHPLFPEGTNGCWSADVGAARAGDDYKYVLDGGTWRTDPRARVFDGSAFRNTRVVDAGPAAGPTFAPTGWTDRVIYELHIGTFRDPDPNDALPGTFHDAIAGLDHLVDLGVTDVEILPVAEFLSDRSWGYNPTYSLAIEDSYGGREGLRAFTSACHARGLRVLVDIVHNHWDNFASDVWAFNGASAINQGGLYFYGDTGRCCTAWGPRPNYDRPEVRTLILDSVREYLDLGCDGFRWDAVAEMFFSGSVFIPSATSLVTEAAALVRARGGAMVAENGAAPCRAGFDAEWSYTLHGALNDQLARSNNLTMNMGVLTDALRATARTNIVFLENHDTAGLLNSWAQRWPVRMATNGLPPAFAAARARIGAVLAFTSRGTPLLFQGQEFGGTNLWHDDRPLTWNDPGSEPTRAFYRDLLRLRRNLDGITPGLLATQQTTVAYGSPAGLQVVRGSTGQAVLVLANLTPTSVVRWMSFPATGWWHVALSTDDTVYSGGGGGLSSVWVTNASFTSLRIPGHTALVLTRGLPPDRDADGDGLTNARETQLGTDPLDALSAAAMGALRTDAEMVALTIGCATGATLRLEASPDLQNWSLLLQTNAGSATTVELRPPLGSSTPTFFRLR